VWPLVSFTTDADHAASHRPLASEHAVKRIPHCRHPSKELNMNATVLDHDSASDLPQHSELGTPMPQKPKAPIKARSAKWLVTALLLLSALPLTFGVVRLVQLAGGAEITPANARFFASPLPVVVHIVSAGVYAPACMLSWARSSSHPPSGDAGPAGTVLPGGCWLHAACWLRFRGCG
jgi:hypothetical protein